MNILTIIVIAPTVVAALVFIASYLRGRVVDVRFGEEADSYEVDIQI